MKPGALERRAVKLTDQIEDHTTNLKTLYAERLDVWQQLVRAGWKHREIAELCRVQTVTVSRAIAKAKAR